MLSRPGPPTRSVPLCSSGSLLQPGTPAGDGFAFQEADVGRHCTFQLLRGAEQVKKPEDHHVRVIVELLLPSQTNAAAPLLSGWTVELPGPIPRGEQQRIPPSPSVLRFA